MKAALRSLLKKLGYEVHAYSPMRSHALRRAKVLSDLKVDFLLDGGANTGTYALEQRDLGYGDAILSVEPLRQPYELLAAKAAADPKWSCLQVALAASDGELEMRESEISQVSSVFQATGVSNTNGWRETSITSVAARRVDSLVPEGCRPYLKLDLQGYELEALHGASGTLGFAVAVEVELSTVRLYEGAPLLPEVLSFLDARGFSLFSVEPALVDYESGRVLQLDGLFVLTK
jgi:FkbM family methyltransferase